MPTASFNNPHSCAWHRKNDLVYIEWQNNCLRLGLHIIAPTNEHPLQVARVFKPRGQRSVYYGDCLPLSLVPTLPDPSPPAPSVPFPCVGGAGSRRTRSSSRACVTARTHAQVIVSPARGMARCFRSVEATIYSRTRGVPLSEASYRIARRFRCMSDACTSAQSSLGKPVLITILACSLGFHAITLERSSFTKIAFFKINPV